MISDSQSVHRHDVSCVWCRAYDIGNCHLQTIVLRTKHNKTTSTNVYTD